MSAPPWMEHAWRELGVEEIPGPRDNPRVVRYHESVDDEKEPDRIAWCSSFVNFCISQAGFTGTNSRAARSWLNWGVPITDPMPGAVTVLWRHRVETWQGHVGFFITDLGNEVVLLGGNQSDAVCVKRFPKERVLGYRWI